MEVTRKQFRIFNDRMSVEFYYVSNILMVLPELEIGWPKAGTIHRLVMSLDWLRFGFMIEVKLG